MGDKISLQEVGGVARFRVRVGDADVVALVSEATWQARFGSSESDASFRELLLANQPLVSSTVVRKAASMSRTEFVLQPDDFI